MDCSPPGSSVPGDSPDKNTGMGCHALLQGAFPTQGLNPGLPHCRRILCQLSHKGSPEHRNGSLSLLRGIIPTQGLNPGLLPCRQILNQLSHKVNPRILSWVAHLSLQQIDLPDPGIELGSPALQVDSLPAELPGSPLPEKM